MTSSDFFRGREREMHSTTGEDHERDWDGIGDDGGTRAWAQKSKIDAVR